MHVIIAPLSDFRCLIRSPYSGIHISFPASLAGSEKSKVCRARGEWLHYYSWAKVKTARKIGAVTNCRTQENIPFIKGISYYKALAISCYSRMETWFIRSSKFLRETRNLDFYVITEYLPNFKHRQIMQNLKKLLWRKNYNLKNYFMSYGLPIICIHNEKQGTTKPHSYGTLPFRVLPQHNCQNAGSLWWVRIANFENTKTTNIKGLLKRNRKDRVRVEAL